MLSSIISYLFHAKLHEHGEKCLIYTTQVTVPEFVDNNRDLLNDISKELQAQFPNYNSRDRLAIDKGIERYLRAEQVLKETNKKK